MTLRKLPMSRRLIEAAFHAMSRLPLAVSR
jgi:hypothetical protein